MTDVISPLSTEPDAPGSVHAPAADVQRGRVLRRLIRNPAALFGLFFVALVVIMAVFAPWLAPHDPDEQDLLARLQGPSSEHLLGTDEFGRDQLSRLIHGARVSLVASLQAVAIGVAVGVGTGMIAGFLGNRIDAGMSRVVDAMMALPGFLVAVTVIAVLGPSLTNAMIAVGLLLTPVFFRVSRAATQDVKGETYIEASQALGCTTRRTVLHHVLPNMLAPVVVQIAILLGVAITIEASLSFIGLGVQPPTSTWGSMLANANPYMSEAPHLIYIPGLMIALTVLAFSLLGDGLATALGTTRSAVSEK
jgi:peptide/nickel transport system permease protein